MSNRRSRGAYLAFAYFCRRPGAVIGIEPVAEMRAAARTNLAAAARVNGWFLEPRRRGSTTGAAAAEHPRERCRPRIPRTPARRGGCAYATEPLARATGRCSARPRLRPDAGIRGDVAADLPGVGETTVIACFPMCE